MAFELRHIPILKHLFGYRDGDAPKRVARPDITDLYADMFGPMGDFYKKNTDVATDRQGIYKECEEMDMHGIIPSVLDLITEDCTQMDMESSKTIWVESRNQAVQDMLTTLLEELETEDELPALVRELTKYGDSFNANIQSQRLDGTPGGIVKLLSQDPKIMHRHEDEYGRLKGFSIGNHEDSSTHPAVTSPWEYTHWRLLGKDRRSCYGTSYVAAARREHRRLMMMEDALAIYRIKRSPDRFVFYVKGLDALPPEERTEAFNRIRQTFRKKMMTDSNTGTVRSEVDTINIDDDFFCDENSIRIERLQGNTQDVGRILDIDYVRKRLLGILKVPPDYLGFSDAAGGFLAQSPLSSQDLQFCRQLKRIQRATITGYVRLCMIHMAFLGVDPSLPGNAFTIKMTPLSYLDELQKAQVLQVKATVLGVLTDIGKALNIEKNNLLQYLIKMSGLPDYLFHVAEKEAPTDQLRGTIDLSDSSTQKKELDKRLAEVLKVGDRKTIEAIIHEQIFRPVVSSADIKIPKNELPDLGSGVKTDVPA